MKKIATKFIVYSCISTFLAGTAFEGTLLIDPEWNDVFAEFQNWKSYLLS